MKNLNTLTRLALGAVLVGASLAPQIARARSVEQQNVTVSIDAKGFHPPVVNVAAGKKVHLTFVSKAASCANSFSIPALGRTINLQPGKKKVIDFTLQTGQTMAFTCTMKMLKGKVAAK